MSSELEKTLSQHFGSIIGSNNLIIDESICNSSMAMRLVFKYLNIKELLIIAKVCKDWNMTAKTFYLWQTICLKNTKVNNWDKCIDAIINHESISLDTRYMFIPSQKEEFKKFWSDFTFALRIRKPSKLKCIKLYRCPAHAVEETISSLKQLSILNAIYIKNPPISNGEKNLNEFMTINLHSLDQMINLTEIKIKGLTGIKLTNLASFESLVNLKSLSLTSIKAFPRDICRTLKTLSISLEIFEIGDCDCLSNNFAGVIKRLTNLRTIRLENCTGKFKNFAKEVFSTIRGLNNLKTLELIDIEFSQTVEEELEKCTNIKALLIIPTYFTHSAATNSYLIGSLKKLSKTLTRLVWGVTNELLDATELSVLRHHPNYRKYFKEAKHIPILSETKYKFRYNLIHESVCGDENNEIKCDIISLPGLETLLRRLITNAHVVKMPFEATNRISLLKI